MRLAAVTLICIVLVAACVTRCAAEPEYLSDTPDAIAFSAQGWGELGIDCAAHSGKPGLPLRIGDSNYSKGIGTHAPGEMLIELDGGYTAFKASVGLQWQDGEEGSVVFKALVDGKELFNSGVMRKHDPAKPVNIPLAGADELRLVVTDAGDGFICDCANWAEAALIPDPSVAKPVPEQGVDIAQFARIQTWDPARMDGARNSRTEEFKAEDLFLGKEVLPSNGVYSVPKYGNGTGCIGLEWLERRRVRQLALDFDGSAPPADGAGVQYWTMANAGVTKGGSTWQGRWEPLTGRLSAEGNRWLYDIDWKGNPIAGSGTLKIRWILPASAADVKLTKLSAYSDSRWATTDVVFQMDGPASGKQAEIEMYNGEILGKEGPVVRTTWDTGTPLKLTVRYSKPKPWKNDRTVIRITLPNGGFGVAVDDLLANDCVYVKDFGFFAAREPAPVTLAQYKKSIAGRKSILEQVREMPDQTLEQAMKHLHRPEANLGPTLLSLACDNHKFLQRRTGEIDFEQSPEIINCADHCPTSQYSCSLRVEVGSGRREKVTRSLAEGWMPIPTITVDESGVLYHQRTFVAPCDKQPPPTDAPAWLNRKPLCVSEFTIENTEPKPRQVSLRLTLLSDVAGNALADTQALAGGAAFIAKGKLLARVDAQDASPLSATVSDGAFIVTGTLAGKSRARVTVQIPGWEATADELSSVDMLRELHSRSISDDLLAATESYWKRMMAPAMQVEVPDALLANVIRASQVHCLLAARNETGKWVAPWIGSMNYGPLESEAHSVIRGMMFMGQTDYARSSLEFFIKRYNAQGFLTTGYTTMGTGWHLWTLGEYYALTRDLDWIKRSASEVDRVCRWVMAQRAMTMKTEAHGNRLPEYGLMPPGLAADWDVFAYYAYLNGYYAAGLREAGAALADAGCADAAVVRENGIELSHEIMRAFHWTQSLAPVFRLRDGTWVPEYPTHVYCPAPVGDFYVGEDVGRSWCYDVEIGAHHLIPMGVMDPSSKDADWMLDHMEDVQFLKAGWYYYPEEGNQQDWFNKGGFAKVQPYYARNAEAYALRDDVKPFIRSYFNSLVSLLNAEDLSFWEHFINGAFNKTHETGYFLHQTRTMLLTERGDQLWLAPFVTGNWLRDGMTVGVKNAPSRFGLVSYKITSHVNKGYIEAVIDPPARQSPRRIVLRLRHPDGKRVKSVTVNGVPHADFDPARECITLEPSNKRLVIRAGY